ncbi:MAG: hypothetical protein A2Y40_01640 [Candidatus Margulisbacteria bacterium GWF2_35_9]|nr:MAG: hypothetical protein A2Y40_01640 [Candidatus Margulisbacteria bacterium GWF2_35_9]
MSIQERKEIEKQELRQKIVDVAIELFIDEGFENLSMRKIADKINYSPTTIYNYFKDKTDLMFQIMNESFGRFLVNIEKAIGEESSDPLEAMKRGLKAYIQTGLDHPKNYRLIFSACTRCNEVELECHHKTENGEKALEQLIGAVTECINHGYFTKKDPLDLAQLIWAALHGLTILMIENPHFAINNRDQLKEDMANMIIRGLKI